MHGHALAKGHSPFPKSVAGRAGGSSRPGWRGWRRTGDRSPRVRACASGPAARAARGELVRQSHAAEEVRVGKRALERVVRSRANASHGSSRTSSPPRSNSRPARRRGGSTLAAVLASVRTSVPVGKSASRARLADALPPAASYGAGGCSGRMMLVLQGHDPAMRRRPTHLVRTPATGSPIGARTRRSSCRAQVSRRRQGTRHGGLEVVGGWLLRSAEESCPVIPSGARIRAP